MDGDLQPRAVVPYNKYNKQFENKPSLCAGSSCYQFRRAFLLGQLICQQQSHAPHSSLRSTRQCQSLAMQTNKGNHSSLRAASGSKQAASKGRRLSVDLQIAKKKPDAWRVRKQVEDGFVRNTKKLPDGDMCLLVMIPGAKNGPIRVKGHSLTMRQCAAALTGLHSRLRFRDQRVLQWVRDSEKTKKVHKRGSAVDNADELEADADDSELEGADEVSEEEGGAYDVSDAELEDDDEEQQQQSDDYEQPYEEFAEEVMVAAKHHLMETHVSENESPVGIDKLMQHIGQRFRVAYLEGIREPVTQAWTEWEDFKQELLQEVEGVVVIAPDEDWHRWTIKSLAKRFAAKHGLADYKGIKATVAQAVDNAELKRAAAEDETADDGVPLDGPTDASDAASKSPAVQQQPAVQPSARPRRAAAAGAFAAVLQYRLAGTDASPGTAPRSAAVAGLKPQGRVQTDLTNATTAKDVVAVLQQLEQDVAAGGVTVTQALADLDFADATVKAAKAAKAQGLWATSTVPKAILAARKTVAKQQLKMRPRS